jgi:hypothetical protein
MTIHGEIRWLVVLMAVIVVIKFLIGWLGKREYRSLDRTLLMAYTILLDINALLGLILLFFGGGISGPRLEHATTMILAVMAAHLAARWRPAADSPIKFRNQLMLVLLSLALALAGVIRLRGGFMF